LALSVHAVGTIAEVERISGQLEAYRYARELIGATRLITHEDDLTNEAESSWSTEAKDD
jgi:hypothetical protein